MITGEMLENSISLLLNRRFAGCEVYIEEATQTRADVDNFLITVDVSASPYKRGYQRKDVEIVIQYFKTDLILFRRNYGAVKDVLQSELFVNSIPIVDENENVVKYLEIKGASVRKVDDVLSFRMTSDYIDEIIKTVDNSEPDYDLIGQVTIKQEV